MILSQYDDEDDYDGDEPRPKKIGKSVRKRGKKTTIFEIFEPSELERAHFTDQDQEIRNADMPERFQLRQIPICPTEEGEQELEADWIYEQAFCVSSACVLCVSSARVLCVFSARVLCV